jgi:hypothetical protein
MAGVYMMAAVAVVGAIGLFNLVLLYGVIRRLREHGELLAGGAGGTGDPPLGLAAPSRGRSATCGCCPARRPGRRPSP